MGYVSNSGRIRFLQIDPVVYTGILLKQTAFYARCLYKEGVVCAKNVDFRVNILDNTVKEKFN